MMLHKAALLFFPPPTPLLILATALGGLARLRDCNWLKGCPVSFGWIGISTQVSLAWCSNHYTTLSLQVES